MAAVTAQAGQDNRRMPKELVSALFALFIFLFIQDSVHNRLGSSNGKFISLVDTCRSVAQHRSGLPGSSRVNLGVHRYLLLFFASFLVKFAASTVVSLLFGKVPLVLSGWRHSVSFVFGFALVWFSPRDEFFRAARSSRSVKLLLGMGGGLYKMRKVIFAVEMVMAEKGNFVLALLVAVLAVDGTTLTRRAMLWIEMHCGTVTPAQSRGSIVRRLSGDITFHLICSDGGYGARQTLLSTVLPLAVVIALVWKAATDEWTSGITDDSFLGLRAALLTLFIWRAGAFHELTRIHTECMTLAASTAAVEKVKAA